MRKIVGAIALSAMLAGCGTFVPSIQDIGDDVSGQQFVQAIVTNVTCEVQNAINHVYRNYNTTFMDDWGVQITLSLTTNEKTSANPTVNWLPPSPATAIFNLAGGLTGSADATRINKMNAFHLVRDLRRARCPDENRPGGLFLMQSDLKLKEWLYTAITADRTNSINFGVTAPFKANVLSHDVKFEIQTSASATPSWKLTRVTVNPSGTFFSVSRGRTHQLTVTLGAVDKETMKQVVAGHERTIVVGVRPSRQAADIHLSSTIGAAVADSLRGIVAP